MVRPKVETLRDRQFNIGLTAREFESVHRAAQAVGMRLVDFARAKLLSKTRRTSRTTYNVRQLPPAVLVQLSRIGNNLNQIARKLNELSLPSPDELPSLLADLRSILREVAGP